MNHHKTTLFNAIIILASATALTLSGDDVRQLKSVEEKLNELNQDVRDARDASRVEIDAARRALQVAAPKLTEVLKDVAEKARKAQAQTSSRA
ncbi:uncharacterized protein METZ01_LOCUS513705, partial [marine metagenome]